ncbi:putative amino acid transporter, transmembrane domain-containing protein [Rosa chinensis]|uniref:Putative amino acid transporter, transmembrane domain-containing protein n=1 Tax=Rosa chinensis TaxID=74649 RepID=A0A2P6PFL0_ROSCH|nr:lysine histidine transporter-like 5 [Rosa chinensis]PRQ20722.1 putative amino acid transporter, transmembrane domain-containing protein [Rosa chinensis]
MSNSTQQDQRGNEQVGDRRTQQQIDASNWLPITADRKAKWYYSAFHNVTAVVGAGVLGLPYAMSQIGWVPGMIVLILSWLITFYSFWQLIELHEIVPGKRFDRYPELGQHCFGPKLGYWIVMPQQLIVQVASGIVYCVTGGKSLKKFFELLWPVWGDYRTTYFILFFICLQFGISQAPNFNSLKGVSLLAALMSIGYASIAFVASTIQGVNHRENVTYGIRSSTLAGQIFDLLNGCGTIAFAFAGHSVALEIQATIPSTPEKPSKHAMWKGVVVAYVVVAFCYLSVSLSGYWAYGSHVEDDVLISLDKPAWLIAAANFMVFIHVIGSYQIFSMPVFDQIEQYLVENRGFTPGLPLRIIARSLYVAAAGFVAMCIPFFGGLLGLFGGLVFASTSFFMPCIMWIVTQKPKTFSFHWIFSWISIVIGVLLAVLSPIGGARTIIMAAKTYKLFS